MKKSILALIGLSIFQSSCMSDSLELEKINYFFGTSDLLVEILVRNESQQTIVLLEEDNEISFSNNGNNAYLQTYLSDKESVAEFEANNESIRSSVNQFQEHPYGTLTHELSPGKEAVMSFFIKSADLPKLDLLPVIHLKIRYYRKEVDSLFSFSTFVVRIDQGNAKKSFVYHHSLEGVTVPIVIL